MYCNVCEVRYVMMIDLTLKVNFIVILSVVISVSSLRYFHTAVSANKDLFDKFINNGRAIMKLKEDDFDDDFEDRLSRKLGRLPSKINVELEEEDPISKPPVLFTGVKWQVVNRALFAGIFVAGIGLGINFRIGNRST